LEGGKGELAMNTRERAEMWKEYFDKFQNTEEPNELIKIGNIEINEAEVEEITIEDVQKGNEKFKKQQDSWNWWNTAGINKIQRK
jgi:hypothetical protein